MRYSQFLMTAALAGCLGLPAAAHAQYGGGSNYGIFGGGTTGAGAFGGTRSGGFGQSSGFGQQQGFSGSLGRSPALGGGSSSVISPYLNLLRPGDAAVNYYALVRPQIRQDALNTQYSTYQQQTDRTLLEQQQRLRQQAAAEANLANIELPTPTNLRNAPNAEGRRPAGDGTNAELRDWANRYRDLDGQSDSKSGGDSLQGRQRAASLRQARELKALEAELAGSADSSQNTSSAASQSQPAQPYRAPMSGNQFRSPNHYFATQATAPSRPALTQGAATSRSAGMGSPPR
jgi:hypothetical protein